MTIHLDNEGPFSEGNVVTISGVGVNSESQTVIQIKSPEEFFELIPNVTKEGEYSAVWQVPEYTEPGTYIVSIDDGTDQATTKLTITY